MALDGTQNSAAGKISSDRRAAAAGDAVIVSVTAPEAAAGQLAELILTQQLGACVQIIPGVVSVFRWDGQVQREAEQLLLIKTSRQAVHGLEQLVIEHHPYEVPEFLVTAVMDGEPRYLDWIRESTGFPQI